jgi:hypothetical protein
MIAPPWIDSPCKRSTKAQAFAICAGWMATLALLATQSGCSGVPQKPAAPERPPARAVTAFSSAHPGGAFPGGWVEMSFSRFRKPSQYAIVADRGTPVIRATSEDASSALIENIDVDLRERPLLRWRWKAPRLVPGADTTQRNTEDAPVRLILAFEGDKAKLPSADRFTVAEIRAFLGQDPPYASLEYVWGNAVEKNTVVQNGWYRRIKMIVVESGEERVGDWVVETRNVYDDFRRAFNEEPGHVTFIGIHSDSDATNSTSEGYFGDITFLRADKARKDAAR